MKDDELLTRNETIEALREPVFLDVLHVHEAEKNFNKERSRAGWWAGGIGSAIGVLGVLSTLVVAVSHQPQVRYTEIDDASGVVRMSWEAKDAPDHYNDRVIKRYLREHIENYLTFTWQLDPQYDYRVKLMSSPDEQKRYAAWRAERDLGTRYGTTGYARVTKFTGWQPRATGKDKTLEWDVQCVLSEVLANTTRVVESRWTVRVAFQFHPEVAMSEADREVNESGLYVVMLNPVQD